VTPVFIVRPDNPALPLNVLVLKVPVRQGLHPTNKMKMFSSCDCSNHRTGSTVAAFDHGQMIERVNGGNFELPRADEEVTPMSLTRKKPADLDTSSTIKAVKRARTASSAAAANAAVAAQNAALAAQNAVGVAQSAAQNAAVVAANAAQNASGAAQTAAAGLNKGVRQGVYTARSWAAPRLDNAADYTTSTVAPKVSAALRTTARQVSPPAKKSSKRSPVLTWSVLGAAILAALGAAAAAVRYRYRSAIAADSEAADEEVPADSPATDSPDSQAAPASPDAAQPTAGKPKDQGNETSVNGRVTASGR
jgi:hypothetical protein